MNDTIEIIASHIMYILQNTSSAYSVKVAHMTSTLLSYQSDENIIDYTLDQREQKIQ